MGLFQLLSAGKPPRSATGIGSSNSLPAYPKERSKGQFSLSRRFASQPDSISAGQKSWQPRSSAPVSPSTPVSPFTPVSPSTPTLAAANQRPSQKPEPDCKSLESLSDHDDDPSSPEPYPPVPPSPAPHARLLNRKLVPTKPRRINTQSAPHSSRPSLSSSTSTSALASPVSCQGLVTPPITPHFASSARSRQDSFQPARINSSSIDILDAQSEIRPLDFRSRVRASGARDFGEDVAERNIVDSGAALISPTLLHLNSPTEQRRSTQPTREPFFTPCSLGDDEEDVDSNDDLDFDSPNNTFHTHPRFQHLHLPRPPRGSGDSLASRRGRPIVCDTANAAPYPINVPQLPVISRDDGRQSLSTAAAASQVSLSAVSEHTASTFRGRRSRPQTIVDSDSIPPSVSPARNSFVPPAIPAHTLPLSPNSLRDSVDLAREKHAVSPLCRPWQSPRSIATSSRSANRYGLSDDEHSDAGDEDGACAPSPIIRRRSRHVVSPNAHDHSYARPTSSERRGRTVTRQWAVGMTSHYAFGIHSPAYSHPEFGSSAASPSVRRQGSFSSSTPTTVSTRMSTPHSMHRPQSRQTAGTSVADGPDLASRSCRSSAMSMRAPTPEIAAPLPLSCHGVESRVITPITGLPVGETAVPAASVVYEYLLDDYLSGSDTDSVYSGDEHPDHTKKRQRAEEDADLLFSDASFGVGGSQQLPGLFDCMPETGIATVMPLQSHPTPKPVHRPASALNVSAYKRRPSYQFENDDTYDDDVDAPSPKSITSIPPIARTRAAAPTAAVGFKTAMRLRKEAKTLARLTGAPLPRRCILDPLTDSDQTDSSDEEDDGADPESYFF